MCIESQNYILVITSNKLVLDTIKVYGHFRGNGLGEKGNF